MRTLDTAAEFAAFVEACQAQVIAVPAPEPEPEAEAEP
jgi:hypothetical protein